MVHHSATIQAHGAPSSGTLHVCICMYVKTAVCMMYVFT